MLFFCFVQIASFRYDWQAISGGQSTAITSCESCSLEPSDRQTGDRQSSVSSFGTGMKGHSGE